MRCQISAKHENPATHSEVLDIQMHKHYPTPTIYFRRFLNEIGWWIWVVVAVGCVEGWGTLDGLL